MALSRRGCIFTMADRYQDRPFPAPTTTIAARTRMPRREAESDPLAELARLIGQTDPFGAAAKPPHPLQSRANVRPQYDAVDEEEVERARRPAAMDAARPARSRRRSRNTKSRSRTTSRAPCIPCTATRPSSRPRMSRTITSRRSNTRTSSPSIPRGMTMRCMASSNPASRNLRAIRPFRMIPTPTRAAMRKSPSRRSAAAA